MRKHIRYRTIINHQSSQSRGVDIKPPEQLIIRVGKGCNFRCIFCNVAENESVLSLKSSITEILAITFYKIKYSKFLGDHINIAISGGEPSIFQKETIFILKYFGAYFEKRGIKVSFDLQSNASNIDDTFARTIARLGITQALVSSHAHDPEIFTSIIGVDYAVMGPKFERGVRALLDAGIDVTFNIILNNINKDHYFEHIQYLTQKYPEVELYNIGFVQPHGMAQENFERLFAQYEDVAPTYSRVIAYLKSHNKRVHSHFVGLPLCYLDDWSNSMEYMYNKGLLQSDPSQHTLIHAINDTNKTHPSACDRCSAKRVCSGVWKEYADTQKLKTITYPIISESTKLAPLDTISLKRCYDAGERIYFFRASEVSQDQLILCVDFLKSLGYVWVVFVVDKVDQINISSRISGINLQFIPNKMDDISLLLNTVHDYNSTVSSQFKIQLDILIQNPEKWNIHTLFKLGFGPDILLHLPRKYAKQIQLKQNYIHYSL